MLAVNGRLLGNFRAADRRALAFPLPPPMPGERETLLSITHLNADGQRSPAGVYGDGRPLGLSVSTLRIFQQRQPSATTSTLPAVPGSVSDGSLARRVAACTGMEPGALSASFGNLGHNCEFGTVQRNFGAEPIDLLRFAGAVTHKLVDGLMARFEGIGSPETTRIFLSDPPDPEFKLHEQLYYLWYSVGSKPAETTHESVMREQCRRLRFLRRKFVEDLVDGQKIFVLTRAEPMTESEALAVLCALQMEGPNRLLWTVHGDAGRAGEVDRLMPGFYRGHLGIVDDRGYGAPEAWLSLLCNAILLARQEISGAQD